MKCYKGKTLEQENATYEEFAQILASSLGDVRREPIVLVRDDGTRLIVVLSDTFVMLSLVQSRNSYWTSYGKTYLEGTCEFGSFDGVKTGKWKNFVDPQLAMAAVQAFFGNRKMGEFVDFARGVPDLEFLEVPEPVEQADQRSVSVEEKRVDIPSGLQNDMHEVCLFLDDNKNDPDVNIDYDDAIQIGSLCGGRMDAKAGRFQFSYFLESGDRWYFEVRHSQMEDIGDGILKTLRVTAHECG